MGVPVVAVVGRPNVGKSTLVNRIAGDGTAIVDASRGVTRDRSYHRADWNGREFVLVDTGGIESVRSKDHFSGPIRDQAMEALDESDAVLFVVDGQTGVSAEDEEVARALRRLDVPVILCVNKVDDPSHGDAVWEFLSLGVGEGRPISATHGTGTGDLLDELVALLPEEEADDAGAYPAGAIDVALVGRPNVGKSSLLNRLAGRSRSIVSDVAGTTRDAIDITVERDGRTFRLVDTAGMRKRPNVVEDVEYYSVVRGLRAMEHADVCLVVVDAAEGVGEQDQKICADAVARGCGLVLLLNKWDLVGDEDARAKVALSLDRRLGFCRWAEVLRVSALSGRGLPKVWDAVARSAAHRAQALPTPAINALLSEVRETGHSVSDDKRRLKIYYGTQTGFEPPQLTLFCNHPDLANEGFSRYLERRFRETFDLSGTPLDLRFKRRS